MFSFSGITRRLWAGARPYTSSRRTAAWLGTSTAWPIVSSSYLNGNRYRLEGLPEGFAISFRTDQGKTELLLEEPIGPSTIRVKQ